MGDGSDSESLAYVVYKPAGWSILGSASRTKDSEYDENNVLELLTPPEREECEQATDQRATPMEITTGKKKGSRIKMMDLSMFWSMTKVTSLQS